MQKNQPKIKVNYKPLWKCIDLLCIFFILSILIYTFLKYPSLPNQVPSHFDKNGNADGFSSKTSIWILPVINIIMFAMLYAISKIPHKFNYVVKITEQNVESQYTIALEMMVYLRLITAVLFSYLTYKTIEWGQSNDAINMMIPIWIIIAFMSFIIIRTMYLSNKYK